MTNHSDQLVLQLPSHAAANDDALRAAIQRVFTCDHVRSISVDGARASARVRLKARTADNMPGDALVDSLRGLMSTTDAASKPLPNLLCWFDPRDRSTSFMRMPPPVAGWRKALYLALAVGMLSLGMVGIVLPGLPTTPFVLLGSYFLVRSSTRLHEKLMASRLFGGVLRDWHLHRGLRPHIRARAVAVVALVVTVSLIVARPPLPVLLAIGLLAACGLTVIYLLPSVRDDNGFTE